MDSELSGRKNAKDSHIAGESPEEWVNTWLTHFSKLLGNTPDVEEPDETIPAVYEGLDIDDGPFTLHEFKKVKTSLKLRKSAGLDGIPPEVFKCCDFDDICLDFCNNILMQCHKPQQWSFMNIIPVPTSENLSVTNNYRGISIREVLDLKLMENQNGFRTLDGETEQFDITTGLMQVATLAPFLFIIVLDLCVKRGTQWI